MAGVFGKGKTGQRTYISSQEKHLCREVSALGLNGGVGDGGISVLSCGADTPAPPVSPLKPAHFTIVTGAFPVTIVKCVGQGLNGGVGDGGGTPWGFRKD